MARFVALLAVLALVSSVHGFNPNSKNDTDTCLRLVNEWTQVIPKTIDDILKGDIMNIIADIGKITPMINQTKESCGNFSYLDVTNQTSIDAFGLCYNSTGDVVENFNQLIADVNAGNVSAILTDIGKLIASGTNVIAQCSALIPIVQNPRLLANFYNSTLCWATHERSVDTFKELLYEIQQGNVTAALPLVLPFVGESAEAIRQCCIYPNSQSFFNFNFAQPYTRYSTYNYNFQEASSNKSETCYGDILALVDGLLPIVKDLNTRNYMQLLADGKKLLPILSHTFKDCPSTIREIDFKPYVNKSALGDFNTCIQDIKQLIPAAQKVVKDITNFDIFNFITDVGAFIDLGKQTVSDCTSGGRGIEIQKILNWYPSAQCSAASDKAGNLAREARYALHNDKERFVQILPEWIEAAKLSFNICHRAPFAF